MILPIGDAPNPRGARPFVNYLLIGLNVAIYLLITQPLSQVRPAPNDPMLADYLRVMSGLVRSPLELRALLAHVSAYDLFVFAHGFRPAEPSFGSLLSSMFLHAGFLHLAGNMLFLWIYGDNVEHALGHGGYLAAYLLSGVAAVWFHAVTAPGSEVPMIGASGAISGVLGFYYVFFPRNRVRLLFLLPPFFFDVFELPARIVLAIFLLIDNLLPFLLSSSQLGVAHAAHIGGFFAGLGGGWLLARRALARRPAAFAEAPAPAGLPTAAGAIRDAIDAGRMAEAARAYFALPAGSTRRLLDPRRGLALAGWLREQGHGDAALVVLRRLVRDHPHGRALAEACVAIGDLLLERREETSAYQYYLTALDQEREGPLAEAARRGLAEIAARQKRRLARR